MRRDEACYVIFVSCACITIVECCALIKGIDGTYLSTTLTILGGIAGYFIHDAFRKK